jgi:hypothetical protein
LRRCAFWRRAGHRTARPDPPERPPPHCIALQVEIKPEMVGHYLAEFSISYKPVKHGRPGIGATHSSRFIPLK